MAGRSLLCVFLVFCLCAAVQCHDPVKINDFLFSGGFEFVDLSHPFDNDTVYWPGGRKFSFTKKVAMKNPHGVWYSANEFCAAEHGGTHLDAPIHFAQNKWTVGQIPIDNLITPLIIVDLSTKVAGNADFVLERHHMDHLFVGDPRRNFTVVFRFGWSQHYGNPTKYLGSSSPTGNNLNFPGISEDVAKWLTETRTLIGVGVDTPSVDPGSEHRGLAHKTFAAKNIFMLENVNLEKTLPSSLCTIIVMPMKIQDGTGAPCRLTAICPRTDVHNFF
ncbi:kynurenine formamidase-like [Arctopsyche grandis]|uniref:kynurenine formamidase-like n=1 Tax=Arctopsyche grandis TaxID=121162 RepID=UPI00406D65C6